jgi:hypothetical protein
VSNFGARVPFDKNDATPHASPTATICRADKMPRITVDMNFPATHFRAKPVGNRAEYFNAATAHLRTEMHTDRPMHNQPARCHVGAQPFHFGQISLDMNFSIFPAALHVKKIPQFLLSITVPDRLLQNLSRF